MLRLGHPFAAYYGTMKRLTILATLVSLILPLNRAYATQRLVSYSMYSSWGVPWRALYVHEVRNILLNFQKKTKGIWKFAELERPFERLLDLLMPAANADEGSETSQDNLVLVESSFQKLEKAVDDAYSGCNQVDKIPDSTTRKYVRNACAELVIKMQDLNDLSPYNNRGIQPPDVSKSADSCFPKKTIPMQANPGGEVADLARRGLFYQQQDYGIKIMGPCYSACITEISQVQTNHVCVGPDAELGFHWAFSCKKMDDDGLCIQKMERRAMNRVARHFSPKLRAFWNKHKFDKLKNNHPFDLIYLRGKELESIYPRCADVENAPCQRAPAGTAQHSTGRSRVAR